MTTRKAKAGSATTRANGPKARPVGPTAFLRAVLLLDAWRMEAKELEEKQEYGGSTPDPARIAEAKSLRRCADELERALRSSR